MYCNRAILVVPTLNAGIGIDVWIEAYNKLEKKPAKVLIIDSSSDDLTRSKATKIGFDLSVIPRNEFGHGKTRQIAVNKNEEYEFVVFTTQDAYFSGRDAFEEILKPFNESSIAAVCGRQLPRREAGPIEAHSRVFNYPEGSFVRSFEDRKKYGVKTAFLSNSYAAYRVSALKEAGGFPDDVIFGEDMYVAARLLKAGWKIAYAADACVYHSHDYTIFQEFKRYFDMGVFHARNPWIRREFGSAEGEGIKYMVSESIYLFKHAFWKIPEALLRTVFRYLGFRLGLLERYIPAKIKPVLSMNSGYFR